MAKAARNIVLYGDDNGECSIYEISREKFDDLMENERFDELHKYQIPIDTQSVGYVPDWAVKLSEIYGFEVDSI